MDTTNLWQSIQQGILPVPPEVAAGMSPETIRLLRQQALLQMGLGMVAAKERGAKFGTGALAGLNVGQNAFNQGLGQAYAANRNAREDKRVQLLDERTQQEWERRAKLDEQTVRWHEEEKAYREAQAAETKRRWEADQRLQEQGLGLQATAAKRAEETARRAGLGQIADAKQAEYENKAGAAMVAIEKWEQEHPGKTHPRRKEAEAIYKAATGREWKTGDTYDFGEVPAAPMPGSDQPSGIPPEGAKGTSKSGKPMVFRNGHWEYV